MARVQVRCTVCGIVRVDAAGIDLVTRRESDLEGAGQGGIYAYQCPDCGTVRAAFADEKVVRVLRAAGVACRGRAPDPLPLTPDDRLDLHLLHTSDRWLDMLVAPR